MLELMPRPRETRPIDGSSLAKVRGDFNCNRGKGHLQLLDVRRLNNRLRVAVRSIHSQFGIPLQNVVFAILS
jgi:hypothetical protein